MGRKPRNQPALDWPETVEKYMHHLAENESSPHTLAAYQEDLTGFAVWFESQYQAKATIADLSLAVLREWKTHLSTLCNQAPASVNRRLGAIRSFGRWLETEGLVSEFRGPKNMASVRQPPRWLTRSEQLSLIRTVDRSKDSRGIAVVKLLLHTGLRIDELTRLKGTDVEISPRKGQLEVLGKGSKQRTVPLNAEARTAILDYRSDVAGKNERVFQGQRGPLTVEGASRIVETYGRVAKLDGLSPHVLRHTFCKNLADSGTAIQIIARLAGHSSLETTRRYVEPGQEDLRAAVERLAGGND